MKEKQPIRRGLNPSSPSRPRARRCDSLLARGAGPGRAEPARPELRCDPGGVRPGIRRRPDRRADPPRRGPAVRRLALLPYRDVDLADRRPVLRHRQSHDRRAVCRAGRRADGRLRRESHRRPGVGRACQPRRLPVPSVVVVDSAIRDEGTSYHCSPRDMVRARANSPRHSRPGSCGAGLAVKRGLVWTTDAPYRETAAQIERHARAGALAVEMQAASLFAFSARSGLPVGPRGPGEQRPGPRRPTLRQGTSRRRPLAAELHLRGGRALAQDKAVGHVPDVRGIPSRESVTYRARLRYRRVAGEEAYSTTPPGGFKRVAGEEAYRRRPRARAEAIPWLGPRGGPPPRPPGGFPPDRR